MYALSLKTRLLLPPLYLGSESVDFIYITTYVEVYAIYVIYPTITYIQYYVYLYIICLTSF